MAQRLRRITNSGRYIPEIDGLRFIAIFSVVLVHVLEFMSEARPMALDRGESLVNLFLMQGSWGVELFFAISGFVLALPFLAAAYRDQDRPSLRAYYLRRVTRLEPPYLLSLLLIGAWVWWSSGSPLASRHFANLQMARHFAASALYLHNQIYAAGSTINPVAWTLEVEVQFYLIAPFLITGFARTGAHRRIVAAGVMLIFSHRWVDSLRWDLSLAACLPYFLAGIILADIYVRDWQGAPQPARRWDWYALVGIMGFCFVAAKNVFAEYLQPFLILYCYIGAFRGPAFSRVLRNPWISVIGGMCYTIYLYHLPVIYGLGPPLAHWMPGEFFAGLTYLFAVLAPIILVFSVALYLLVERPCMRRDWPFRLLAWIRGGRSSAAPI